MRDAFLSWVVSNVVLAGLIAAAAFLVSRYLRNPHLAHGLWLLVLIKLVTPPIYVLETTWFQKSEAVAEEAPHPAAIEPVPSIEAQIKFPEPDAEVLSSRPADDVSEVGIKESRVPVVPDKAEPVSVSKRFGLTHGLVLLWSLGTLICAAFVFLRTRQFRKLLALSTPADEGLQNEIQGLSRRLGMKRCPSAFLIDAQIPPLVWGLVRRPRILLPRKLFGELTPEERQTVLAHELAHIRRGDHLLRWIEVGVVVLFWWYPIAWWASREMRRAEEECCDALVIWALPEARQCYGQALCKTIEFLVETRLPIPQIAGGAFGARPLKRRIEMIMQENVQHRMSWKAWSAMLLVAAIALPVVAQNAGPEEPKPSREAGTQSDHKPPALPREEQQPLPADSSFPGKQPPPADSSFPGGETAQPKAKAPEAGEEQILKELEQALDAGAERVAVQLKPSSDVQISSLQSGTILKVHVTEGQAVKKGDRLVELRNTETELRYQEALGELKVQQEKAKTVELAVRLARAELIPAANKQKHTERLNEKGLISNTQLQDATAAAEQSKINLEKAESEAKTAALTLSTLQKRVGLAARLVEELSIKAPADGIVLDLYAKAGELVKANGPVARVVSLSPLAAETHIQDPEGLLDQMVLLEVRTSKVLVRRFPAKVTFVSPITDPVSRTTRIRCLFNNAGRDGQPLVRPGQSALIYIPAKE